jgi:hypothetical protein
MVLSLCTVSPGVASLVPQTNGQPDPVVVAGNVRDIRNAVREIDARIQQSLGRDALKSGSPNAIGPDVGTIRAELQDISKIMKALDQRLARVQTLDVLKPPSGGDKSPARRDFRSVTTAIEAAAMELDQCHTRVNKIEALVIKQTSRSAQPLATDLDFIKKHARGTQDAMKRVLFGG